MPREVGTSQLGELPDPEEVGGEQQIDQVLPVALEETATVVVQMVGGVARPGDRLGEDHPREFHGGTHSREG